MNIICFTFEAPTKKYGGGIGIIQSLSSLTGFADVTYVGPYFSRDEFCNIKLKKAYFLKDNNSIPVKAFNLFRGVTTKYYQEWKRTVKKINPKEYDLVYVDFSYNDYIIDWAHKNNLKTIVRVHNIEKDMSYFSAHGKTHDKYWLRNVINGRIIANREKKVMNSADALVFLTKIDYRRGIRLYGENIKKKSYIIPVCIDNDNNDNLERYLLDDKYILATGSLYYGPNSEGIIWFLDNVWSELKKEKLSYYLVVAGGNPTEELKNKIRNVCDCVLIESPDDMAPYFKGASLYVAPVFSGAGMKVKVAEALSYGLKVIGTKHALIGYDEIEDFCIKVNTADEYINEIKKHIWDNTYIYKDECMDSFNKLYSIKRSVICLRRIANKLLE